LSLELLVLSHVGAYHALDLALVEEQAQAEVVHASVVTDHGQVPNFGRQQARDELLRDAAKAET